MTQKQSATDASQTADTLTRGVMEKTPIDIEVLLQWAIGQSGHLPWRGVSPRELMFDYGYTVIPRGCERGWHGGGTLLRLSIDDDASRVIEAIKRLEPRVAGIVIACARSQIRPDWMQGVEPKRVPRKIYQRVSRRGRRRHRSTTVMVWNIDPAQIAAARSIYERWHAALTRLAVMLDGSLDRWVAKLPQAHPQPWTDDHTTRCAKTACNGEIL